MKIGDFGGVWSWEQRLFWTRVCELANTDKRESFWFATDDSMGIEEDFEACTLAAEQGDERAQRYMAKFMELRMKS